MGKEMLTRTECNALRGIAILGIVLHNYCHWLRGIVRENEYQFFQRNVDGLHNVIQNPDWNLPVHLLSFFGHYGVPVFLFLSAYGLVCKYERLRPIQNNTESAHGFIWAHFKKLFMMMIPGFVAFVLVDAITPGSHHYHLLDVVAQLGLFNNVLPDPDHIIWPGPYWFFGLMLQLYIVYRLFLYRRHWGWTFALMAICTLAQLLLAPESEALNRYRYNFMGGMLPFGLGLLYARMPMNMPRNYNWLFLIVSLMLVYSFGQTYSGWIFVPVFICSAGFTIVKILPSVLLHACEWMGGISAALFVCHPIIRKIIIPISHHGDVYAGLLLYIVSAIVVAVIWKRVESFKLKDER